VVTKAVAEASSFMDARPSHPLPVDCTKTFARVPAPQHGPAELHVRVRDPVLEIGGGSSLLLLEE